LRQILLATWFFGRTLGALAEKSLLNIARPLPDTHRVAGEEMGRLAPALPE
jgi:hypothetical protein